MSFDNVNVNVNGPVQPASTYKTKVLKGNHSFASQVTEPNMKYVIKHDFVLDGDITVPENCVLEFDGGSISGAYTLIGQNTYISGTAISGVLASVGISGTFSNDNICIDYFITSNNITQTAVDKAKVVAPNIMLVRPSYTCKKISIDNCNIIGLLKSKVIADSEENNLIHISSNVSFRNIEFTTNEYCGTLIYKLQDEQVTENIRIEDCSFVCTAYSTDAQCNCIDVYDANDVFISNCTFIDGWNDHNYDASNYGGSNIVRAINIHNHEQANVSIVDCKASNVWTFCYIANTDNVIISRNIIENTADTGIFERCTAGRTSNKQICNNVLKNIGKSAIKTLDTNNDIAQGSASIISCNNIENWGVCLASGAILAASNYVNGSYQFTTDKSKRQQGLIISQNVIRQTSQESATGPFQLYNIDNLFICDNIIDVEREDELYIAGWSNGVIANNYIKTIGVVRLYQMYGDTCVQGNRIVCSSLRFTSYNEGKNTALVANNTLEVNQETLSDYAIYVPANDTHSYIIVNNIIKANFSFNDSYESNAINVCTQLNVYSVFNNNVVVSPDGAKMNTIPFGTYENPTHYQAIKGQCTIESNGNLRYTIETTNAGGGSAIGAVVRRVTPTLSGETSARPSTPIAGQMFFDNTLSPKRPIWYTGSGWVDATGVTV